MLYVIAWTAILTPLFIYGMTRILPDPPDSNVVHAPDCAKWRLCPQACDCIPTVKNVHPSPEDCQ